jgi:hypothetical protein
MGAAWHLRLPVLRGLFEAVNTPGALGTLRLDEVLEWAAATLFTLRPIGNKTRLLSGNSVRWITRRHVSGIVRPAAIRS